MRAVDTNVLVRLLARDAPGQVVAAEAFVQAGASASLLVLMDTLGVGLGLPCQPRAPRAWD